MDFSKLSNDQLLIANKITTEAEKVGLDPNLALAVGYQESRFNATAKSSKGAVGPMQLMPETAKMLKVNPNNLDDNIRGGVVLLKNHMDEYQDPLKALVAYNTSNNTRLKYFKSGDFADLPDETLGFLNDINQNYPVFGEEKTSTGNISTKFETTPYSVPSGGEQRAEQTEKNLNTVVAGGVSAPVAGAAQFGRYRSSSKAAKAAESAKNIQAQANATAQAIEEALVKSGMSPADARAKVAGASGTANYARKMPGQQLPEVLIDQIEDMTKGKNLRGMGAYDVAARDAENMAKIRALTGNDYSLVGEGRGQLMLPPAEKLAQEEKIAKLAAAEALANEPSMLSKYGKYAGKLASKLPILNVPLSAMGAAHQGTEAMQRGRKGDYAGAGLAGMSALGSALSMTPWTAPVGIPMALVGEGGLSALDFTRKGLKEAQEGDWENYARNQSPM
jgi:hypothetical protein